MEDKFYVRPTGRLKSVHPSSYGNRSYSKKSQDSVYSLEDYTDSDVQHPTGKLSKTQLEFIHRFVNTMCGEVDIDITCRSIHWIGSWRFEEADITVSCSMIQPNISTCSISLSGVTERTARIYADRIFPEDTGIKPSINKTPWYCQLMGKYSIPFADAMVENGLIRRDQTNPNNVVLTNTQVIFCIVQGTTAYECTLTHSSCKIIMEVSPDTANISPRSSTGHNYTFRSPELRGGGGTGPSVTIHVSGSMQYQGNPDSIVSVMSAFRSSLISTIESKQGMRFLRSLCVVRKLPIL